MKNLTLALFILTICSGTLFAQNTNPITITPVKANSFSPIFFNRDTTAIIGNATLLTDIGYENIKKDQITTRIKTVDLKDLHNDAYSLREYLLERVPGYSGQELIVIDGVPGGSIYDVSPSVITSIQYLHGASAAIYGVRGFYGVIVITTK